MKKLNKGELVNLFITNFDSFSRLRNLVKAKATDNKIYYVYRQNKKYVDCFNWYEEILNLYNIEYTLDNDAPRGGRTGNFIAIKDNDMSILKWTAWVRLFNRIESEVPLYLSVINLIKNDILFAKYIVSYCEGKVKPFIKVDGECINCDDSLKGVKSLPRKRLFTELGDDFIFSGIFGKAKKNKVLNVFEKVVKKGYGADCLTYAMGVVKPLSDFF